MKKAKYKIQFKGLTPPGGGSTIYFEEFGEAAKYIASIENAVYDEHRGRRHIRDVETQDSEIRHIVIYESMHDIEAIFFSSV